MARRRLPVYCWVKPGSKDGWAMLGDVEKAPDRASRHFPILFVAEGNQRIDGRGAARRNISGGQRDEPQDRGGSGINREVPRFKAIKNRLEKPSGGGGRGQARGGAERHADPDLARAARDVVREDAIKSESGENGGQRGENGGERGKDALGEQVLVDLIVHSFYGTDGQVGIERSDGGADGGFDLPRIDRGAEIEMQSLDLRLAIGDIENALRRFFNPGVLGLLRHPDDFDIRRLSGAPSREAMAERVLAREKMLGELFIDDGDFGRGGVIGAREIAAGDERNAHGAEVVR